ncbi:PREDICTED: uncharacterized protein LOC108370659 [Rhagoletis zephyria]|uniref:uncharacterized protein LOC108370659 n=1 Tax=Rhagoletis zephyria TaxID=28612 RepID=UPI000811A0BD|nr:PREDICTED: uncharacterized protein LOC108370659 [Rhagoletis zephyria]
MSTEKRTVSRRDGRDPKIQQCVLCYRSHALRFCKLFLNMNVDQRIGVARSFKCCVNCLARTHDDLRYCGSLNTCSHCKQLHHTLLHRPKLGKKREAQKTPHRPKKYARSQPVKDTRKSKQYARSQPVKDTWKPKKPNARKQMIKDTRRPKRSDKQVDVVIQAMELLRVSLALVKRGRYV